jgi:hypothetical protein
VTLTSRFVFTMRVNLCLVHSSSRAGVAWPGSTVASLFCEEVRSSFMLKDASLTLLPQEILRQDKHRAIGQCSSIILVLSGERT